MLAISHGIHRKLIFWRKTGLLNIENISGWVELKQVVTWLVENLSHQQQLLVSAAINGLSLIASVISLPLSDQTNNERIITTDQPMDMKVNETEYSKLYVSNKLLYLIQSAHSRQKIREEAAHCLGCLAVGDPATFTQRNLNAFVKMLKMVCTLFFGIYFKFAVFCKS